MVPCIMYFVFFKQKTAYDMRISDWSSDVGSSDLWGWAWLTMPARPASSKARLTAWRVKNHEAMSTLPRPSSNIGTATTENSIRLAPACPYRWAAKKEDRLGGMKTM